MEYHHIDAVGSRWGRGVQEFKDDLLWFYNNGYYLMSMEDFADSDFSKVPAGKKPVVFTFDDGLISQFQYLADGSVDPNCAIGILDDFYTQHPDFGRAVMFYVNADPFGQPEFVQKKLQYLYDTGRQIGYHTLLHTNMKRLKLAAVVQIFVDQTAALEPVLPKGMRLDSFAYPFGVVPTSGTEILKSGAGVAAGGTGASTGVAGGGSAGAGAGAEVHYAITTAVLVGADPSYPLNTGKVDALRIPRIQGIDSEFLRHFGRQARQTAPQTEHDEFVPYVVRGDSQTTNGKDFAATQQPVSSALQILGTQEVVSSAMQTSGSEQTVAVLQQTAGSEQVASDSGNFADGMRVMVNIFSYKPLWSAILQGSFEGRIYRRMSLLAVLPQTPGQTQMLIQGPVDPQPYRGIYLTAYAAGSQMGQDLLKKLKESGGNLVVFDMKEVDGHLFYPTTNDINIKAGGNGRILLADPKKFIEDGKAMGFRMVARVACFKDELMAVKKPEWAIHNFKGKIWRSSEGQTWLDPSLPAVQDYILSVAKEAAAYGVDEVQFDYVRFPTQGQVWNADYSFDEKKVQHYEVIRDFLKKAHEALAPMGVKLGVDLFGVVVWNNEYDSGSTGQKVGELAPYIDAVYPMVYPSHFGKGFAGYKNPGDAPYFFVNETVKLFKKLIGDYPVAVRPWLQAFPYKVSAYNGAYVQKQVDGARDAGTDSFVLWNAGNNYEVAWGVFGKGKGG